MLSSQTKKLLFIANLKSPPNDHASFYASSEKDRFLYTSCLIASGKRTRSDIYVVHTWGKKSGTAEYLSAANGEIFYPVFCRSEWFPHGNEYIILYRSREIWEISRRVQKKSARTTKTSVRILGGEGRQRCAGTMAFNKFPDYSSQVWIPFRSVLSMLKAG